MGVGKSILQSVRDGERINVNVGTFGGSGSVFCDSWVDRVALVTGRTSAVLFKDAVNSTGKTPADTNNTAQQVPAGQRWDLTALSWYIQKPDGSPLATADKTALNLWLQGVVYTMSYGKTVIRSQPLWTHTGSQLSQEVGGASATPGLMSTSPRPLEWKEYFPEEAFLPMAQNVVMDFTLQFPAVPSTLNGWLLGASFDRVIAVESA